jgi:hypothetical protein
MLYNTNRRLGDGNRVILCQRIRGSVRAVTAIHNTPVFLTETELLLMMIWIWTRGFPVHLNFDQMLAKAAGLTRRIDPCLIF